MGADGRYQLHYYLSGHVFHFDKGRASGRRGHKVSDGGRHFVFVGGVHSLRSSGRAGMVLAAVLDIHHAENWPDNQVYLVLFPAVKREMDEKDFFRGGFGTGKGVSK